MAINAVVNRMNKVLVIKPNFHNQPTSYLSKILNANTAESMQVCFDVSCTRRILGENMYILCNTMYCCRRTYNDILSFMLRIARSSRVTVLRPRSNSNNRVSMKLRNTLKREGA
jgi:hypothetical protein